MSNPIKPTIGRVVLVTGSDGVVRPGLVSYVHSDVLINVDVSPAGVSGDASNAGLRTSVGFDPEAGKPYSWHWMPFQLQAAAKAAAETAPPAVPAQA